MPIEIDCPECAKETKFFEWIKKPICEKYKGTLKITAYTQEELDKAVQAEREACALICENVDEPQISIPNIKHIISKTITIRATQKCAEAIRAREKPQRVFCTWCRGTSIYHNKPCSECKDGVQEFE